MTIQEVIHKNLTSEYRRLEKSDISEEAKKKIREFVTSLKVEHLIGGTGNTII